MTMNSFTNKMNRGSNCKKNGLKDVLLNNPETKLRMAVKESEVFVEKMRRNAYVNDASVSKSKYFYNGNVGK